MNITNSQVTMVLLAATMILLIVVSCFVPTVGATLESQEEDLPDTPEEYLSTFQRLEGTEAFETHTEFEIIRSQAVQDAQVGEFTASTEQRLETVLMLLTTFEDAVEERENENYAEAIALGNEARELADELREIERGEEYALLADIALGRFYEETGESLLAAAEETDNTPERIELLSESARAYDQAGATERFGQVEIQADRTEQEFTTDLETINETDEELSAFVDRCEECNSADDIISNEHVSVFGLFADAMSAMSAGDQGISLADQHGLTNVEEEMRTNREIASEYRQNLAIASATLLLGYSVTIGLVAALITWRVMLWKRDFTDSQYGDVILMGEMLNA